MTRAALYARFSTDLQNQRSIADQLDLCRAYAAREGLTVVATYEDSARSGGSLTGRDGLARLMDDARARAFDVIIVEALDRLSRDMEDLAGIHKRLTFAGVDIRAVHEGQVNTVLVGLRGLVGQLYREDNAHKIRRALAGLVREGRSAGGCPYGYAVVPGQRGARAIVPEEAKVIRRIYNEYASGVGAREIAAGLNADGVPPARGRAWCASSLNGGRQRGSGILRNRLYVGEIEWNKNRQVRDPDSGKHVHRPNAAETRIAGPAPELAIIPRDLWDAVQARLATIAGTPPQAHRRRRHVLSGLLRCGACGSGLSTMGTDKSGRRRLRCSRHRESGDCPDPQTFYLDVIERRVLGCLRGELLAPAAIDAFVAGYREEMRRLTGGNARRRETMERRLGDIGRELDRVTDYLARGIGDAGRLDARAKSLAAEERTLRAEMASAAPAYRDVILHPALLRRYAAQVETLEGLVGAGHDMTRAAEAEAIRQIITRVTVRRRPDRALDIDIDGRLDAVCGMAVGGEGYGHTAYPRPAILCRLSA